MLTKQENDGLSGYGIGAGTRYDCYCHGRAQNYTAPLQAASLNHLASTTHPAYRAAVLQAQTILALEERKQPVAGLEVRT